MPITKSNKLAMMSLALLSHSTTGVAAAQESEVNDVTPSGGFTNDRSIKEQNLHNDKHSFLVSPAKRLMAIQREKNLLRKKTKK